MSYYSPIPNGIIQGKSSVYNSVVWVRNNDSGNGEKIERPSNRFFGYSSCYYGEAERAAY
ncbi:hypothetical protein ES319_D09G112600v1 [Gossypium barbadense]|uniref:Uncharacterized protein n=2 Tax=Gossypium TaxID=3633 RepID=A0A5J5Q2B8_GOSBA|nr:hypothetical protein ES319_D09G112600v1 [Gossypium barbadense]TYG53648.1 hypothetical protein ES288_D09G126500v1 [Gossypium darwinii]